MRKKSAVSKKPGKKLSDNSLDIKNDNSQKSSSSPVIYLLLLISVLLYSFTYLYIFDRKIDLNGDNAYYYMLGKAISQGEGYVHLNSVSKSPNNQFPPGYPVLTSGTILLFGDSFSTIKLVNGVLLAFSLFVLFQVFRKISESGKISFVALIFLILNSHLLLYGTMMMSEVMFLLFSSLTIWTLIRNESEEQPFKKPWIYLVLILLVISYYTRTTGVALFGGIILYMVIKKKWRETIFIFITFIGAALPWYLRSQKLGGSIYLKPLFMINPYRAELGNATISDYFTRFFDNISRYITKEIPNSMFPFFSVDYRAEPSISDWIIGLLIVGLIIYGLFRLKKYNLLIFSYLLGTFGILLLWPEVWRGVRFVLPVAPLLLLCVIFGTTDLFNRLFKKAKLRIGFNPLALLVIAIAFIHPIKTIHRKAVEKYPANWRNYFEVARWIKKQKDPSIVVSCRKPVLFYLHSGSYTTSYKYVEDDKVIIDDLKNRGVDYVVLENLGYRQTSAYLYPAIEKNNSMFTPVLVLKNPNTYLLKFNSE